MWSYIHTDYDWANEVSINSPKYWQHSNGSKTLKKYIKFSFRVEIVKSMKCTSKLGYLDKFKLVELTRTFSCLD